MIAKKGKLFNIEQSGLFYAIMTDRDFFFIFFSKQEARTLWININININIYIVFKQMVTFI